MQTYLIAAAVISIIVGLVHSVLGEVLIFSKLRTSGLVPSKSAPPLQERNVRILWATWHLASVFCWAFTGILISLALDTKSLESVALNATTFAFLGGSLLVLIGTKGKHPGWFGLLAVAVLVFFANAT